MGGYGSTRWGWHSKAITVEESRSFPVSVVLRYGGIIRWLVGEREMGSAGYDIHRDDEGNPTSVTMYYSITPHGGERQDYRYPIQIISRTSAAGIAQRLWRCPLIVDDQPCGRTVRTLYLPAGARYFGCRHCHGLVYRSAQEHNKNEWRRLAMLVERVERLTARQHERERRRSTRRET